MTVQIGAFGGSQPVGALSAVPEGDTTGSGRWLERITCLDIVKLAFATRRSSLELRRGGNATSRRLSG